MSTLLISAHPIVDSDKAHSELLRTVFKISRISKMTRLDSDHMCTGRPCKVSHFKQSSEKFILHYKCSHNMKCWHEKNLYRCWQFNSWIANTYTFDKYLYMLVVLLVLARCWQINWPLLKSAIPTNTLPNLAKIHIKMK